MTDTVKRRNRDPRPQNQPKEPFSQRELALRLRIHVDRAVRYRADGGPWGPEYQRLDDLIAAHPFGIRSRHVLHNLGKGRVEWLKEEGFIGDL